MTKSVPLFFIFAQLVCESSSASASTVQPKVVYRGQLVPENVPAGFRFGGSFNSVDIFGNLAVVAASHITLPSQVHVFDISDPLLIQEVAVILSPPGGLAFGESLAVLDEFLFVGDPARDDGRGAVYMYDMHDPANIIERKITAFDANPDGGFGYFLAGDRNRLLVGAPKFVFPKTEPPAAYVIDLTNPDQLSQIKLLPNAGEDNDYGRYGDILGNFAIIGQISDNTQFPFNGAAYLYDLSNPEAIRHQKLFATDTNYRRFGDQVALTNNVALVGVSSDPGPTHNAGNADGAVWAFDLGDWSNLTQVEFGRPVPTQFGVRSPRPPFGAQMSAAGSIALIGAFAEDDSVGAVYLWDVEDPANPSQLLRITPPVSGGPGLNRFGSSVAFDGRNFVVADRQQRVFLFSLVPEPAAWHLTLMSIGVVLSAARMARSRVSAMIGHGERRHG